MEQEIDIFKYNNNFAVYEEIKSILIKGEKNDTFPLVSIVIPTYKRPELLKEAIDSALNQLDFNDYEVIVVDNEDELNKKTDTDKLIETYSDKKLLYYKNEKNIGMTGNWNRCIELARGKWITILHDDDILHETFLKEMMKQIMLKKEIELLVAKSYIGEIFKKEIFKKEMLKKENINRINIYDLIAGNISPAPGIIFNKKLAVDLGGFEQKFYPCMDYLFWIRYCLRYNGYIYNKKLSFYRTFDSETNKGNTLIEMVQLSNKIKIKLLKIKQGKKIIKYSKYIISMNYWQKINKEKKIMDKNLKKISIIQYILAKAIDYLYIKLRLM